MSATPRAGAGHLVGVGVGAVRRRPGLWVLGAGLEGGMTAVRTAYAVLVGGVVIDAFLRGMAAVGLSAPPERMLTSGITGVLADRVVLPLLGLALAVELLGAGLRAFYLGAAVEVLSTQVRGADAPHIGLVASGANAFARATLASIWLAFLELAVGLWRAVVWGGALLVVGRAFAHRQHGFRAAVVGGAAVALIGLVTLAMALLARVYLVRAVRGPGSTLAALTDAIALVRERLLTYLGILLIEVGLSLLLAMVSSAPSAVAAGVAAGSLGVQVVLRMVGATIAGVGGAGLELAILGAVCGADLDAHGELPVPPAPPAPLPPSEPVYAAEEVLVAEVIAPPPTEPVS